MTLREYYERKRSYYGQDDHPEEYTRYLRLLFSRDRGFWDRPTAASFLRKHRQELRTWP